MLPLGDAWTGVCQAAPDRPWQPEEAMLRPLCNLGYARRNCSHFPAADDGPDAVRFTISHDDGSSLGLYYVVERDHLPFAHGPLEYSRDEGAFASLPADATVGRQASVYVESYLRRKSEASHR